MPDELLDLVDENDKVIGTVKKSDAHKDPSLIHREIMVVVENDRGEILLQRRSLDKKVNPGLWQLTAAGHVGAGEDPLAAANRELGEEMGIEADLKYWGKELRRYKDEQTRFFWIYTGQVKGRPEVSIDSKEVKDAKWVKKSEFEALVESGETTVDDESYSLIMNICGIK